MGHSEETKRKISAGVKGKLIGRKRSRESVLKGAESRKRGKYFNCIHCDSIFWRSPSRIILGETKFCSKPCFQKWEKGKYKLSGFKLRPLKGDKNPNWKGGITPESVIIRNSNEYKLWRKNVFERDSYTCQECKRRSCKGDHVYLEAHHIKPFAVYPELRLEVSNGQTLCKKCHHKKPKGIKVYESN